MVFVGVKNAPRLSGSSRARGTRGEIADDRGTQRCEKRGGEDEKGCLVSCQVNTQRGRKRFLHDATRVRQASWPVRLRGKGGDVEGGRGSMVEVNARMTLEKTNRHFFKILGSGPSKLWDRNTSSGGGEMEGKKGYST